MPVWCSADHPVELLAGEHWLQLNRDERLEPRHQVKEAAAAAIWAVARCKGGGEEHISLQDVDEVCLCAGSFLRNRDV